MTLDPEALKAWSFPEIEQSYTARDTMLYALGIGASANPLDSDDLRFTYEGSLQAIPSMCVTLGTPGFWIKDPATGITWQKVLHGEQGFEIHAPIQPSGTVIARNRVRDVIDKGEGRGALIYVERDIEDKASGERLASLTSTYFCRADGGFGGVPRAAPKATIIPDRPADHYVDSFIDVRACLIYRLSGDYNPLHADPVVATASGFAAPIFHGLGSLGVASLAIVKAVCGYDAARLKSLSLRFTAPVMPGETLRTEVWHDDGCMSFRSTALERGVVALDSGLCKIAS
jgi:acyl dehydratase